MQPGYHPPQGGVPDAVDGATSRARRFLAWLVDFLLTGFVCLWLLYAALTLSVKELSFQNPVGRWELLRKIFTGRLNTLGEITSAVNSALLPLYLMFLLLPLLQFAYQTLTARYLGGTFGKRMLGLRVRGTSVTSGTSTGVAMKRAFIVVLVESGLYSLSWILLIRWAVSRIEHPRMELPWAAFSVWLLCVTGLFVHGAMVCGRSRRSLADRTAGSVVADSRLYARAGVIMGAGMQAGREALQSEQVQRVRQAGGDQTRRALRAGQGLAAQAKQAWQDRRQSPASPPYPAHPPAGPHPYGQLPSSPGQMAPQPPYGPPSSPVQQPPYGPPPAPPQQPPYGPPASPW